jgi:hypothetical protein
MGQNGEESQLEMVAYRAVPLKEHGQIDDKGLQGALHCAHHVRSCARTAHIHIHLYVIISPAAGNPISGSATKASTLHFSLCTAAPDMPHASSIPASSRCEATQDYPEVPVTVPNVRALRVCMPL